MELHEITWNFQETRQNEYEIIFKSERTCGAMETAILVVWLFE